MTHTKFTVVEEEVLNENIGSFVEEEVMNTEGMVEFFLVLSGLICIYYIIKNLIESFGPKFCKKKSVKLS